MVPGLRKLSDGPYECTLCKKMFTGPASYAEHRNSEKHRRQSTTKSDPGTMPDSDNYIKCEVCDTEISGMTNLEQHDKGRKHQNKLEQHFKWEREQAKLPVNYSCPPNVTPPSICAASPSLASTGSGTENPRFCQLPLSTFFSISPANTTQGHKLTGTGASDSTTDVNHHEDSTPDLVGPSNQVHSTVAPAALLQGKDNVRPLTAVSFTHLSLQVGSGPYQCRGCKNRFMGPDGYKLHSGSCTAIDNFIRCDACNTEISGAVNLNTHNSGKKHAKAMLRFELALAEAQNQPIATVSIPDSNSMLLASVCTPPCATSLLTVTNSGNVDLLQHSRIGSSNSLLRPKVFDPPDSSSDVLDSSTREASSTTNFSPHVSAERQSPSQKRANDEAVKIDDAANRSQGKNQEEGITSTYNGETEKNPPVPNFVKVVYNEAGTMCRVGDLEGYSCKKCKILLFEDLEAAELHYKMHSSSKLTQGLREQ